MSACSNGWMVLFILSLNAFSVNASAQQVIRLAVPEDVLQDVKLFLNGRSIESVQDYRSEYSRRDVVEVVLIQQALKLGGLDKAVELVSVPSYARGLREIQQGRIDLSGTSVWRLDAMNYGLQFSPCLICQGEFETGFYTREQQLLRYSVRDKEDLKALTVVSSRQWKRDWVILNQLAFKEVIDVPNWVAMVRLLTRGRVDLVMAPFQPGEDMSFRISNTVRLMPVPGIKVAFPGSRHIAIAPQQPRSLLLKRALSSGLQILQEQGVIRQAYEESGFFNTQVKDWKQIND